MTACAILAEKQLRQDRVYRLLSLDVPAAPDSDEGLLPRADVVIFDEAHKIPEIALNFFGEELSTFSIKTVVKELQAVLLAHFQPYAPKDSSWAKECDAVVYAVQDAVLAMDEEGLAEDTNLNLKDFVDLAKAAEALEYCG